MPPIVFSHGNSFPSGTYNVLFGHLRQRGFDISAVERFGHDPRFPVTNNWPHLVEQLAEFAQAPRSMTMISTLSPLQMDRMALDSIMLCAEHGQAMMISPGPMAGATGPVTLAGVQRDHSLVAVAPMD